MFKIVDNMPWPPKNLITHKMEEHSAWYSGEPLVLANFYGGAATREIYGLSSVVHRETFWSRQLSNKSEVYMHVPIANDIAETSANFLFSESPTIKVAEAHLEKASGSHKETQQGIDDMLMDSGFFRRILEAAETCAALGGVFIKIAWDEELSPYPIPVIMQADKAIPEFKFGILTAVTFWERFRPDKNVNKAYTLLERYERGAITYKLYLGTDDRLGTQVDLNSIPELEALEEVVETVDELLAVYVPNALPNRLDRSSYMGRADFLGIEGLMDSFDETYSSWIKDIILAQAKLLVPESFLSKHEGNPKYNMDKMLYVKLDVDPLNLKDNSITPQQFNIRADEFEKTTINLMERIVTTAGYSPQTFGLKIEGRAESGTALGIRERKSFATKSKKENYWQPVLKRLVRLMMMVYNDTLSGTLDEDITLNVAFTDSISNDLKETSTSVKMISDALAASTETKVRMLHPDWEERQIKDEVAKIIKENGLMEVTNPDNAGINF